MEPIKVITFNDGAKLEIISDQDAESPREWDNNGTMVCFHSRHNLGDKHDYDSSDFNGWDELRRQIESDHDVVVILPLYLYDHSGITMNTTGFSCRWDSGQVGFIFATRENLIRGGHPSDVDADKVETWLKGEVETYDQYLRGDTCGFKLFSPPRECDHCHHVETEESDSCWGFYGSNPAENGMCDHLDNRYRTELYAS